VAGADVNLVADVGAGDWMHWRDWTRGNASIWKDHNSKKDEERDNKTSAQLTNEGCNHNTKREKTYLPMAEDHG